MNVSAAYDTYSDRLLEKNQDESIKNAIENRAEEILKNFNNGNDQEIINMINQKLEGVVDYEIYNEFLTKASYSQAESEIVGDTKKNERRHLLRHI